MAGAFPGDDAPVDSLGSGHRQGGRRISRIREQQRGEVVLKRTADAVEVMEGVPAQEFTPLSLILLGGTEAVGSACRRVRCPSCGSPRASRDRTTCFRPACPDLAAAGVPDDSSCAGPAAVGVARGGPSKCSVVIVEIAGPSRAGDAVEVHAWGGDSCLGCLKVGRR